MRASERELPMNERARWRGQQAEERERDRERGRRSKSREGGPIGKGEYELTEDPYTLYFAALALCRFVASCCCSLLVGLCWWWYSVSFARGCRSALGGRLGSHDVPT